MMCASKKVPDLRQIKPSCGLNSFQALICVTKTVTTTEASWASPAWFYYSFFYRPWTRSLRIGKLLTCWPIFMNFLCILRIVLLVGMMILWHSTNSVEHQESSLTLSSLVSGWGKHSSSQAFSHVCAYGLFAGFIQNPWVPFHLICHMEIWTVKNKLFRLQGKNLSAKIKIHGCNSNKLNCLNVCILKERRIRIILMLWAPYILWHVSEAAHTIFHRNLERRLRSRGFMISITSLPSDSETNECLFVSKRKMYDFF